MDNKEKPTYAFFSLKWRKKTLRQKRRPKGDPNPQKGPPRGPGDPKGNPIGHSAGMYSDLLLLLEVSFLSVPCVHCCLQKILQRYTTYNLYD